MEQYSDAKAMTFIILMMKVVLPRTIWRSDLCDEVLGDYIGSVDVCSYKMEKMSIR